MMDLNKIIKEGLQNFTLNLLPQGNLVIGDYHEILSEDSDDEYGGKTWRQAREEAKKFRFQQRKALEENGLLKIIDAINERSLAEEEKKKKKKEKKEDDDIDFDDVYCDMGKLRLGGFVRSKLEDDVAEQAMAKSVLVPGLAKLNCMPPLERSIRQAAKERRKNREASKGKGWFDMRAGEVTEEVKNDLQILKMRSALDPKQFFKKNDMKETPKYFQVGTVVESAADFYSSRVPKKQRKRTMVEELLADAEFQQYNKRRYKEIVEERRTTSFKAHRHAARLKRKGKSKK